MTGAKQGHWPRACQSTASRLLYCVKIPMNVIDRATILKFHRDRMEAHGRGTAEALGWKTASSQSIRFGVLSEIADLNEVPKPGFENSGGKLQPRPRNELFPAMTYPPIITVGAPTMMAPPCAVVSPIRAAGTPPIITVAEPFKMESAGPTHTARSPTRAAGKPTIKTVGNPGPEIGPPTCGTGGTPGVSIGHW